MQTDAKFILSISAALSKYDEIKVGKVLEENTD